MTFGMKKFLLPSEIGPDRQANEMFVYIIAGVGAQVYVIAIIGCCVFLDFAFMAGYRKASH